MLLGVTRAVPEEDGDPRGELDTEGDVDAVRDPTGERVPTTVDVSEFDTSGEREPDTEPVGERLSRTVPVPLLEGVGVAQEVADTVSGAEPVFSLETVRWEDTVARGEEVRFVVDEVEAVGETVAVAEAEKVGALVEDLEGALVCVALEEAEADRDKCDVEVVQGVMVRDEESEENDDGEVESVEDVEGDPEREPAPVAVPRAGRYCAVGNGAQEPSKFTGLRVRTAEAEGAADRLAHEADTEGEASEDEAEGDDVWERDTRGETLSVAVRATEAEMRGLRESLDMTVVEGDTEPDLLAENWGEGVRSPVAVRATEGERDGILVKEPPAVVVTEALRVPRNTNTWAVGKGAWEPSILTGVSEVRGELDGKDEKLAERDARGEAETEVEAEVLRDGAPEGEPRLDTDTDNEGSVDLVVVGLREAG